MDRRRLLALLLPTGVSLGVHLALLALITAVSITAIRLVQTDDPGSDVVITLESPAATPSAATAPPTSATSAAQALAPPTPRAVAASGVSANTLTAPPIVLAPAVAAPPTGATPSTDLRRAVAPGAAFAGLRATRARRVVYVVDISGPMASSLSFVLDEVRASVSRLDPTQHFQVILFREDLDSPSDGGALWLGPPGQPPRLVPATAANRAALAAFLDDVRPAGRSNPLTGLRRALELQPDAVFLLARGISRTGPNARWGEGVEHILAQLDLLNPARPTGQRRTAIKTIQFIDDDPTGLMQAIAAGHGGAPDSYIRRNVEDLQDAREPSPIDGLVAAPDPNLDRAAVLLESLGATRADLRVLFSAGNDADRAAVRQASSRALQLVGAAEHAEDADELASMILARALVLRAASEPSARGPLLDRAVAALDTSMGAPQEVLATAAVARALRQSPGDPAEVAALAGRAVEADPSTPAALEARLAAVLALAGDAEAVEPWLADLDAAMEHPPFVAAGRLDAPLVLLALDASATARMRHAGTPAEIDAALAQHLEWAEAPRPGLPSVAALTAAGAVVPADAPLDQIDPRLALARGLALLPAPGQPPSEECLHALDMAAVRAGLLDRQSPEPGVDTGELASIRAAMAVSLWAARAPMDPDGQRARADAVARLDRSVAAFPGRAWRRDAALHILSHTGVVLSMPGADADDPTLAGPRRRALHILVVEDPRPDANADLWRLELAQRTAESDIGDGRAEDEALALLEGPWSTRPNADIDRLLSWIYSSRVARLGTHLGDAVRTGRESEAVALATDLAAAARLAIPPAERIAPEAADALRADLAEALILLESPDAAALYADLRSRGVTLGRTPEAMTLGHARALIAAGDEPGAFALLRDLTAANPEPPAHDAATFWHAWTLTIEILASRAGDDPEAMGTASAHLLRLADVDPELGGEPWAPRLRAAALSIGLSLDPRRGEPAIHSPP